MSEQKILPNSVESEIALVWCMLIDDNIINSINLKEEDFYDRMSYILYQTVKKIKLEWNKVDILMLKEELEKKGLLEWMWWITAIVEIIEGTPVSANWKQYLQIIKDTSNKRKGIRIWMQIQDIWFNATDNSEVILTKVKNMSENIFEIEDNKWYNVIQLADKFVELQDRFNKFGWLWYTSCYRQLDVYTWWIIPWTVQTIVAYSNTWKSSFAYSYIPDLLKKWKKVLFLSNEVMSDILFSNILKTYYKKSIKEIMDKKFIFNLWDLEHLRIVDWLTNFDELKIIIENSEADVVFVDFIQNLQTWWRSEYETMTEVAVWLQQVAIKTGKTIFAISQANNDSRFWDGTKMQPKWSGAIFASSDIILALYKDWEELKLSIIKNKFWPKDINFLVNNDFSRLQFTLSKELWTPEFKTDYDFNK